jgi:hypothetical protein
MKQRLFAALLATALIAAPAFAKDETISGNFNGKVMCKNGQKVAEFKDIYTLQYTYYGTNVIKKQIDVLTWPPTGSTMGFDERETQKVQLKHAMTMLKNLTPCNTPNELPPAPSPPPTTEPKPWQPH